MSELLETIGESKLQSTAAHGLGFDLEAEVRRLPANRLRFHKWVQAYGPKRLAGVLGVHPRTLRRWSRTAGVAIVPDPTQMRRLHVLSLWEPHAYGPITYDDMMTDVVRSQAPCRREGEL